MSNQTAKPAAIQPVFKTLPESKPKDMETEVANLIAAGKCKQAVERAKEHHKRTNSPESQKLLVDAYISRIAQFQEKGQAEDARMLIQLIKERFPAHMGRLEGLETSTAASGGMIDDLVAPLVRPDITDARREAIETAIRRHVIDIQALGTCKALPETHPLRVAAAALWRAFEAVTAGPVTDEQIALAEVSRRSPLMGWRMLIRAIAAFHRQDDEGCRRALETIPPDVAVARLGPGLLDILSNKPPARGAAGVLHTRIAGSDESLRTSLRLLESAFNGKYLEDLRHATINVIRACDAARPELTDTFRQRLMVQCIMSEVPLTEVNKMLGMTVRDASFWRMLARGFEQKGDAVMAALAWDRFIAHGVAEKLFAPGGTEAAVVYGHAARILFGCPVSKIELFKMRQLHAHFYRGFYQNQPPQVVALMPRNTLEVSTKALDADGLARQSLALVPDAQLYRDWDIWAQYIERPVKEQEDICLAWQKAFPRVIDPPLRLSRMAEDRKALSMAQKRLAEAEAIDPFNPAVRKARSRLIIATFFKHMNDGKLHLAAKDLADLGTIDIFKDGEKHAIVQAGWFGVHILNGRESEAKVAADMVGSRLGSLAGSVLLRSMANASGINAGTITLDLSAENPQPVAVAEAEARLIRLTSDLGINLLRPREWTELERKAFEQKPCPVRLDDILLIGKSLFDLDDEIVPAYAATSAGLQTAGGAEAARFLTLRGRILSRHFSARAEQCLRAARELARQVHDGELLTEISDAIARLPYGLTPLAEGKELDADLLSKILTAERNAGQFPKTGDSGKHLVTLPRESRFRGFGMDPFGFGGEDEFNAEDDDDFEDEDDLDLPYPVGVAGPPNDVTALLHRLIEEYGEIPDPTTLMRDHPELVAQVKKIMMQSFFGQK